MSSAANNSVERDGLQAALANTLRRFAAPAAPHVKRQMPFPYREPSMEQNPFTPPTSKVADLSSPNSAHPSKYLVVAVVAMFAIHIAIFANYFGIYFELVRTGAMHPLGPLFGLVADTIMFFGVVQLLFKRYTKLTFLISGAGLLLASTLTWSMPFDRTLVFVTYVLGAAVAFFGYWVASPQRGRHGI